MAWRRSYFSRRRLSRSIRSISSCSCCHGRRRSPISGIATPPPATHYIDWSQTWQQPSVVRFLQEGCTGSTGRWLRCTFGASGDSADLQQNHGPSSTRWNVFERLRGGGGEESNLLAIRIGSQRSWLLTSSAGIASLLLRNGYLLQCQGHQPHRLHAPLSKVTETV